MRNYVNDFPQFEEEKVKLEELKEKEESEIINDSNLFPPAPTFDEDREPSINTVASEKSNLPLYFGIGGGIILIGALLVYKFR